MYRFISALVTGFVMAVSSTHAETSTEYLAQVLMLDEVTQILREEGLRYGDELNTDMLGQGGGQYFHDQVREIYDPESMQSVVFAALGNLLNEQETADSIAFFDTGLGQRILSLENAARVAMADPAIEEIARETYNDLLGTGNERLATVSRFIAVNDLIERNVASALNSNYQFFRGLAEAGGSRESEADILSDVWSQEAEIRDDTESWLFSFLLMAYRPLSDDELEAYYIYSETPAGQALNAALFAGFDSMYDLISYQLGQAVARAMGASDI